MKKIILAMTLLFLLLFSCTAFASDNWQWAASNSNNIMYIDDDSIKYGSTLGNSDNVESIDKNIITFSEKGKYSEEGLQKLIDRMKKENNHLAEWDKVSYFILFKSIDVKNKTSYTIKGGYYDSRDRLLYAWHANSNTSWKEIKSNSLEEACYNHAISYSNNHDSELESRQ